MNMNRREFGKLAAGAVAAPVLGSVAMPAAARVAKVRAVMGVAPFDFIDEMEWTRMERNRQLFVELRIPWTMVDGDFWGLGLERGIQTATEIGAEIVMTILCDSVFKRADVEGILPLMALHPEAFMTASARRFWGRRVKNESTKFAIGHFAFTAPRVRDLLKVPRQWFEGEEYGDGRWGFPWFNSDLHFWDQVERGLTVLRANHITVDQG